MSEPERRRLLSRLLGAAPPAGPRAFVVPSSIAVDPSSNGRLHDLDLPRGIWVRSIVTSGSKEVSCRGPLPPKWAVRQKATPRLQAGDHVMMIAPAR